MLDLKEEQCSVSESLNNNSLHNNNSEMKRCTECQTTNTPLWRGGPAGPKTLCNACGIKFHKRRRALLGIEKSKVDKNKKKNSNKSSSSSSSSNGSVGMPLKIKVMASGIRQTKDILKDKLGEVEQAAMLLMALSYGSVYA
ncbi:GATA transcription factor 16 [Bienertia sinuspersici]